MNLNFNTDVNVFSLTKRERKYPNCKKKALLPQKEQRKLKWCDSSLSKTHFKMIQLRSTATPHMSPHKNYNLLKQTDSQSKQVPPTFKATNSCPPTTLPKTATQIHLWPAIPTRHMGSEAVCRFTKQISSTKCTGQTQAKIIPKRRGGKVREGEEDVDRDSQSFTLYTFA